MSYPHKKTGRRFLKENHMMNQDHPGYEDKVGQICIVMKPSPESTPEDLVHTSDAFGMGQYDPSTIHGIYNDEREANLVAEAICSELQQHLAEIEKKKGEVTVKLEAAIAQLQKEVNRCMDEGADMKAQEVLQRIAELRNKHQMVEASKKPIEDEDSKKKIEEGWLDRTTAKVKGAGAQVGAGLGNLKAYLKGDKDAIKDPALAKNMAILQQKARTLDKDITGVYTDILKLFPQEKLSKLPSFQPVYNKYLELLKSTRVMSSNIASGNIQSDTPTQDNKPEGGKPESNKPEQTQKPEEDQKQEVPNATIKIGDKNLPVYMDPKTKKYAMKHSDGTYHPAVKSKSGRYYAIMSYKGKDYPVLRDPKTKQAYIKVDDKKLNVSTKNL